MMMENIFRGLLGCCTVSSIPESQKQRAFIRTFWLGLAVMVSFAFLPPGSVWADEAKKTEGTEKTEEADKTAKADDEEETKDPEEEGTLGTQQFPNGLMLRAGWYYLFGSKTTITSTTQLAGIGTTIDFEDTLGGDTTASNVRVDAKYRFNPRHSLGFTYYRVAQSGNTVLDRDITIEDTTIKAGAQTTSGLSINLYRFMYNWSFYNTDKIELALSPGLYMADLKFNVSGNATIQVGGDQAMIEPSTVEEAFTAPLPSIGGYLNYYITPRFSTELRADVFWLQAGDFIGSMVEFYAGAEYRIWDNFAVGAAYDRLQVRVDISDVDTLIGWNLVYVYGSLYFFDL